tara:strand:- start:431 stop:730 length:300 start_codon:yes stop_codon:yes gene_type:complete
LAKYARDPETTEKLYVNGNKDLYIEIAVQSKPMDGNSALPPKGANTPSGSVINQNRPGPLGVGQSQDRHRRHQTKNEPISKEDFELVEEYKQREIEYRN